jgi:hypothetical protein
MNTEGVDRSLLGLLIVGVAFLPWVVEVLWQVRLQARFLEALPPTARGALPRHPRRPILAFLGGLRFDLAMWRTFRRDQPDDAPAVAALKQRMRASVWRELAWAVAGLGVLLALVHGGWRPWS